MLTKFNIKGKDSVAPTAAEEAALLAGSESSPLAEGTSLSANNGSCGQRMCWFSALRAAWRYGRLLWTHIFISPN